MKKINLAITGCLGRMGQQLIKSSKDAKDFKLISVTENRIINKKVSGLKSQLNSESAFKNANIIIDFTIPKCTLEVLKIASKLKKRYSLIYPKVLTMVQDLDYQAKEKQV